MEAVQPERDSMAIGDLQIRSREGLLLADGRPVPLSVREFGLLVSLARRAGRIVRREDLYAEVWGGEMRAGDRSVDVYIHKLRVKLETALPQRRYIHTHVGFGYRLEPDLSQDFHTEDTPR